MAKMASAEIITYNFSGTLYATSQTGSYAGGPYTVSNGQSFTGTSHFEVDGNLTSLVRVPTVVPEPSTLVLLGLALPIVAASGRLRRLRARVA